MNESEEGGASALADTIRDSRLDKSSVQIRMQFIKEKLAGLDELQRTRFEFFMRSHFSRADMTALLADALKSDTITEDMGIVVASLAKLLVGEVMSTAISIMKERGEYGAGSNVKKENIKDAYRQMREEGKLKSTTDCRQLPFASNGLHLKRKVSCLDDVTDVLPPAESSGGAERENDEDDADMWVKR